MLSLCIRNRHIQDLQKGKIFYETFLNQEQLEVKGCANKDETFDFFISSGLSRLFIGDPPNNGENYSF